MNNVEKITTVILVEPEYQGNIGAVARAMKNTGFEKLFIVGKRTIDDEALSRARDGASILLNAYFFNTLKEAIEGFDIVVGSSSVKTSNFKKFRRIPITPRELWQSYGNGMKKIALVFGREGDGLSNEEISMCNVFIHIPSSKDYSVYNLSHAVTIVLYEALLYRGNEEIKELPATGEQTHLIVEKTIEIMKKTNYPQYKIENTAVMLERLLTRSSLTEHEFYKIMGIIKKINLKVSNEDGKNN
ncbi:MAG: rRNA methylase [Thermoplasmatales archaeon E-plasma]|jgi:TrmH family RNA methyltransferase|nr:MAG: rRNA methylase [Thermoplasmatales archaeon E-plasma]